MADGFDNGEPSGGHFDLGQLSASSTCFSPQLKYSSERQPGALTVAVASSSHDTLSLLRACGAVILLA